MAFLTNPHVQSILALGALMAAVALAITLPAMVAEGRKFLATHNGVPSTPLETRVEYLEREIDALAVEIERLGESQRYFALLMQGANSTSAAKSTEYSRRDP